MKKLLIFLLGSTALIPAVYANTNVVVSPIKTDIPTALGRVYQQHFNRYIQFTAPNGQSFYIVAQQQISDEQLRRSANIASHYLSNYPNSTYGADKSAIANEMANNQAILALLNGSDNGENSVTEKINAQPLYEEEIQVEGGDWYMQQNYRHRDAAFEEILHWVHDNGIGIDEPDSGVVERGAAPQYQQRIRQAQQYALNNQLWGIGEDEWIDELTEENSLSQEYLAAVIDAYYGLWGAWNERPTHSMWGIYLPKDRAEIATKDPKGLAVVQQFFHPYLTYNARIDANFNGNFSLKLAADKPYTQHSQYLKDITLLGNHPVSVTVNGWNNHIIGNDGDNTVIFSGKADEYTVSKANHQVVVTDKVADRDGKNTLENIEQLQFSDKPIKL